MSAPRRLSWRRLRAAWSGLPRDPDHNRQVPGRPHRLRWRAILLALGYPRSDIHEEARIARRHHRCYRSWRPDPR